MEGQLYIRVRGRVLGPYDREKLRDQVRRGQLSRMHEVSPDGVTWDRASNHSDLFQSSSTAEEGTTNGNTAARPTPAQQAPAQATAQPQPMAPQAGYGVPLQAAAAGYVPMGVASPVAQTATRPAWYYTQGDQEIGPVDFTQLQQAVSQGTITAEDQVWTEGMPDWTSPTQVRGLNVRKAPAARPTEATIREEPSDIPSGVLRTLASSRGWVMFIAVYMFIAALLTGLWGIMLLVRAGQLGGGASGPFVFAGLVVLVEAMIFATTGILLSIYFGRTGEAMMTRKAMQLERTFSALNALWIFISILLIISIALMIVLIFMAISVESSMNRDMFPNMRSPAETRANGTALAGKPVAMSHAACVPFTRGLAGPRWSGGVAEKARL